MLLACNEGLHIFNPSLPNHKPLLISPIIGRSIAAVPASAGGFRLFIATINGVSVKDMDEEHRLASVAEISQPGVVSVAAASESSFYATWRPSNRLLSLTYGRILHLDLTNTPPIAGVQVAKIAGATGIAIDPATAKLWAASLGRGIYTFAIQNGGSLTPKEYRRSAGLLDGELVFSQEAGLLGNVAQMGRTGAHVVRLLEKQAEHADLANTMLRKEESRWETVFVDDGGFWGGGPAKAAGLVGKEGVFLVGGEGRGVVVCSGGVPIREGVAAERKAEHDEL